LYKKTDNASLSSLQLHVCSHLQAGLVQAYIITIHSIFKPVVAQTPNSADVFSGALL
jgi:hypothetical protein